MKTKTKKPRVKFPEKIIWVVTWEGASVDVYPTFRTKKEAKEWMDREPGLYRGPFPYRLSQN